MEPSTSKRGNAWVRRCLSGYVTVGKQSPGHARVELRGTCICIRMFGMFWSACHLYEKTGCSSGKINETVHPNRSFPGKK